MGRRGARIIDLDDLVPGGLWTALCRMVEADPPGRGLSIEAAQSQVASLAGLPVKALSKAGAFVDLAIEPSEEATVLVTEAPEEMAAAIGRRLDADAVAGLRAASRFGRLTGDLEQPGWSGPCKQVVCMQRVREAAIDAYGRPARIPSVEHACLCVSMDGALATPRESRHAGLIH